MFRIFFKDVRENIQEITRKEHITLTESFENSFIKILPSFFSYQEESTDIKPSIIFTRNIEEIKAKNKMITTISTNSDDLFGGNLKKNLKTLLPFCNSGWTIYINFTDSEIDYGLLRTFTGIRGLTTQDELFSIKDIYSEDTSLLSIDLISQYELAFKGIKDSNTIIDFRFDNIEDTINSGDLISEITDDILSGLPLTDKKTNQSIKKIITTMHAKSHGSILLILKSTCRELPEDIFMDGIWLRTPIDLLSTLNKINSNNSKTNKKQFINTEIQSIIDNISQEDQIDNIQVNLEQILLEYNKQGLDNDLQKNLEKFYAHAGLLYEMVNIDGATIINDMGQIVGYNCFAKNDTTDINPVYGGARKRAFNAILNSDNSDIIGVYFQSQNGEKIYEKRCENE